MISVVAANDSINVATTTGLQGNGVQTITFDRPFSNIVSGKTYYIAQVISSTAFSITDTPGNSLGISLLDQTGSTLSPLGIARSGAFTGVTREQSGATGVNLTMADNSSSGTVSSGTGIQVGQRVVGADVPDDAYVNYISGTSIKLSKAVTAANPTNISFPSMGTGSASAFTYSPTQPIALELIAATSVPQISHWGSSVIMDGDFDEDRAYVYSAATKTQRNINNGDTKAIIALRVAPSVDNGISGNYGSRELVNRMQLLLRQVDISSNGKFFVELVLNPNIDTAANWIEVGGTSLAQYAPLNPNAELIGGEVIFSFFSDNGVNQYSLKEVKELSNSILGGGTSNYASTTAPDPTGIFPDGPEVLAVRCTNIAGSNKKIDARLSWTEAQA